MHHISPKHLHCMVSVVVATNRLSKGQISANAQARGIVLYAKGTHTSWNKRPPHTAPHSLQSTTEHNASRHSRSRTTSTAQLPGLCSDAIKPIRQEVTDKAEPYSMHQISTLSKCHCCNHSSEVLIRLCHRPQASQLSKSRYTPCSLIITVAACCVSSSLVGTFVKFHLVSSESMEVPRS